VIERAKQIQVCEGEFTVDDRFVSLERTDALWCEIGFNDLALADGEQRFLSVRCQAMFLVLAARGIPCEFVSESCRCLVIPSYDVVTFVHAGPGYLIPNQWDVGMEEFRAAVAALL
jgi:hypothetical protein